LNLWNSSTVWNSAQALGTLGTESDPALGGLSWYRLGDNRRKHLLEISTNSVAVTTKIGSVRSRIEGLALEHAAKLVRICGKPPTRNLPAFFGTIRIGWRRH
jgi:hypothetical protein